ncbi:MAG: hypothetical protein P0Y48_12510 [Candidatus Microbacterium phytovorans]|uniref:Uncharacterized protein n=1 Tax=Candidatus Microbacterium phytovorans TaxID=3121374 RepID=A0AAJ6B4Y8_9MICO|nr:hypothetical protein [Microbacterium sp.]WEK13266.1 MAG: hypothetical protein P0Y48_12510 [Microbacterium sp.]
MSEPSSIPALADAVKDAVTARTRHAQRDAQLAVAERLVAEREAETANLQRDLGKELADVRRLDGISPTRLWATLRGNAEEQRAVEQAEADAAARALAAAQARLAHARDDADRLRREREELGDVEVAYRAALARYEAALTASDAPQAAELAHLSRQLGELAAESREIDEAAQALHAARVALADALQKLDSAGGWSTYDTFFGGGMITDLMKHSRIDEATASLTQVNRALERLSVELADIDAPALRGVEISQTLAVFDVLFDNVFADWMVRERISQARDGALALGDRLAQLAQYLGQRAADAAGVHAAVAAKREAILTSV